MLVTRLCRMLPAALSQDGKGAKGYLGICPRPFFVLGGIYERMGDKS